MDLSTLLPALVAALLCAVAGLGVPALVARVPDIEVEQPEPSVVPGGDEQAGRRPSAQELFDRADEHPDLQPAQVAESPGLRWQAVLWSALLGAGLGWSLGFTWPLLFCLPLVPLGVALAAIDLHTHFLPTYLIKPLYLVTVALVLVAGVATRDWGSLVTAGLGWLILGGIYVVLWILGPVGYGDVRLSGVLGVVLGWFGLMEVLWGLVMMNLLGTIGSLAIKAVTRRKFFPMGPFLLLGTWVMVVFRAPIMGFLGYS